LACAFTFQVSRSRVTPRSWPTTIPLVITSTEQPRSASSSAADVAWWKPSSSTTITDPAAAADPSITSRTSATRGCPPDHHRRPAADHVHPPAGATSPRRGQRHGLPPGPRVLDAAEPAVQPHPADAFLVAGQAGADPGRLAGPRLGREVRVGDLAADHADQVA